MAYAMTKRGNLDNCVTYEFMCDTVQDMNDIEDRYRTIGSIAIVLEGYSGMEVYIAGSDKQWRALSAIGGGSGGSDSSGESEGAKSDLPIYAKNIEETTIEIENVDMDSGDPQEIDIDTTLLHEGPATVEIGNYSYEVEFLYGEDEGFEYFNNINGSLDISLGITDSSIWIYDDNHTFTELQTIRIIYPAATQLYSIQDSLYLGADENGNNGVKVITTSKGKIAVGGGVTASGTASQAFGLNATASGYASHAEGSETVASEYTSHAEGLDTVASGYTSHAEGDGSEASGHSSHAEGAWSVASGNYSHAEGTRTTASGDYSHAEGYYAKASGNYSHAEGQETVASGAHSHAEGKSTTADGAYSHVEGQGSKILTKTFNNNNYVGTGAQNFCAHAEGFQTWAIGQTAHAEGYQSEALGKYSHAEGNYTIASGEAQHTGGTYNVENSNTYAEIIGNGTSHNARSNARALTWTGDERLKGDLYVGCNADSTGGKKVTPLPTPPKADGTYTLQCTVSNNTATYSWVSTT